MRFSAFGTESTHVGIRSASSSFFDFTEIVGAAMEMETLTLRMFLTVPVAKSLFGFIGNGEMFEIWLGDPETGTWTELEVDVPKQVHLLSEHHDHPMESIINCRVAEHHVQRESDLPPRRFRYRDPMTSVELGRGLYVDGNLVSVDGVLISHVDGIECPDGMTVFLPPGEGIEPIHDLFDGDGAEVKFVMENRIDKYTFSRVAEIDRCVTGPKGRPRHLLMGAARGRGWVELNPADDCEMRFSEVLNMPTDALVEKITGRPVSSVRGSKGLWEW